jgi:hypothetical protein
VPLRAIDFHVHLPTPDWLDGSMAGYVQAAEQYFRSPADLDLPAQARQAVLHDNAARILGLS